MTSTMLPAPTQWRASRMVIAVTVCIAAAVVLVYPSRADAALPSVELHLVDDADRPLANVLASLSVLDPPVDGPAGVAAVDVGQGRTNASGRVAVPVAFSDRLARLARTNGGWVNFEVAFEGQPMAFISFSRRWSGANWVDRSGASSAVMELQMRRLTAIESRAVASPRTMRTLSGYPHATCVWWGPISSTQSGAIVGELHTGHDVRGSFQYGATADSDLDVGYKYGSGSWFASGTAHVGTSESAEVAWINKGPEWRYALTSEFLFGKYEYIHDASCGPNGRYDYKVAVARWVGGTGTEAKKTGTWCTTTRYRTKYYPGSRLNRYSYRAHKYSVGISAFGATLGGVSGYSQYVDFSLTTGTQMAYYWLCGDTDYPTRSQVVWSP